MFSLFAEICVAACSVHIMIVIMRFVGRIIIDDYRDTFGLPFARKLKLFYPDGTAFCLIGWAVLNSSH